MCKLAGEQMMEAPRQQEIQTSQQAQEQEQAQLQQLQQQDAENVQQQNAQAQAQIAVERLREIRSAKTVEHIVVKNVAKQKQFDPYENMSQREKDKEIEKEQKRRDARRKQEVKEQKQIAKMCHAKVKDCSTDGRLIAEQLNAYEDNWGNPEFNVEQAGKMKLDLDLLRESDYVETGYVTNMAGMIDQMRWLERMEGFRRGSRAQWDALDDTIKKQWNSYLDKLPAYQEYMKNMMKIHDLKLEHRDNKYVWSLSVTSAAEKKLAKERCADIYNNMKAKELDELHGGGATEYPAAVTFTNESITENIEREKREYDAFLDEVKTNNASALTLVVPQLKSTTGLRLYNAIKGEANWCIDRPLDIADYAFGQRHADKKKEWPTLMKDESIVKTSLLAVGCTVNRDMAATRAEDLMDSLEMLKKTEERLESVANKSEREPKEILALRRIHREAIEAAYEQFERCFQSFHENFDAKMQGQSAFSLSGLMRQQLTVTRFVEYKKALSKIAGISPSLKARIPVDQLQYLERVTAFSELDERVRNVDIDFRNLNTTGASNPEFQHKIRLRAEVLANENDVHYRDLPAHDAYRMFADRYAEATGLTPETAFQLARRMNLDPSYLEQLPGFTLQYGENLIGMSMKERMRRVFIEPEQARENEPEVARIRDLIDQHIRTNYPGADAETVLDLCHSTKFTTLDGEADGLVLWRFTNRINTECPDMTDEEKVALYDKIVRIKMFKLMEENDRKNRPEGAPEPENIIRAREALRQDNADVNQWVKNTFLRQMNQYSENFGDLPTQLHIMDLMEAVPDYEKWLSQSQDMNQMLTYLTNTHMLTEEEVQKYGRIAQAWSDATIIMGVAGPLVGNANDMNEEAAALMLTPLGTMEQLHYGPSMTPEQLESYIKTVRARYPNLLYGRFANTNPPAQANNPGAQQ